MTPKTRRRLGSVAASIAALVALVFLLFPLYAVVVASFETNSQLFGASTYSFFPSVRRCPTTRPCCPSRAGTW